jgi:uncharacterized protein Veg
MGIIGKDFKYKIIKNFLTLEEVETAKNYFIIRHRLNIDQFDEKQMQSSTCDSYWYADPLTESFLLSKRKKMEEVTQLELLPTYSYSRLYTYLATLEKHKDRPSCEISVTVMVDSSGEKWPIFMDGTELNLEPGDAAVYLGCEVEHWREAFQGDWHSQFFLHYVNKNGKYTSFFKDNRVLWGQVK